MTTLVSKTITAIAVGALLLGIAIGWGVSAVAGSREDSSAVTAAARQDVVDLMSYDYRRIDSDLNRGLSRATGPFRDKLSAAMDSHRKEFTSLRSVSSAVVVDAAVQEIDGDHATLLMFVDQTISNRKTSGPQTDHTRVVLSMDRVDGAWLVSDLTLT